MRSRLVYRSLGATLLVILAAALPATAALAGHQESAAHSAATNRPDASIRVVKSLYYIDYEHKWIDWTDYPSWQGVGTYNTTGTGQTANGDTQNCCPEKHTFNIAIKNGGTTSDRFKVKATGSGFSGWTIKYFLGSTNITSAVVAGTYRTPQIAPGDEVVIKVKLTGDSEQGSDGSRLVTVTSVADSTKKDAVKFKLKQASWCYC